MGFWRSRRWLYVVMVIILMCYICITLPNVSQNRSFSISSRRWFSLVSWLENFNAHHGLWSTKGWGSAVGNNLVVSLFNFPDLCLLTPRDWRIYYHVPTRAYSTLDLCFLSSELFSVANLMWLDDMGGDHAPIVVWTFSHWSMYMMTWSDFDYVIVVTKLRRR